MGKSQWYIGSPNGVVLCVDHASRWQIRGRLYHAYSREGLKIANMEQLLFELEHFYDSIDFPHPSTNNRTFQGEIPHIGHRAGKEKVMSDEELLGRHGDLGTFIIRVQHRQNSSWQGRITWMDQDNTAYAGSEVDKLKVVDSALDTVSRWEDDRDEPAWPEESE